MAVETREFGKSKDGRDLFLYTISNSKGMKATVTNLGAILTQLMVPDQAGKAEDITLGYETVEDYYDNESFFGAVIGPCANRTAGAMLTIDGVSYQIDVNDGENNLHSHFQLGYHKRVWEADVREDGVTFRLEDPGTLGFPGTKEISIAYTVTEDNDLKLHYHGTATETTVINLTNHTYFNLDGVGSGKIEDHELQLFASHYTPVVKGAIPTGEIAPVAGTPLDFTKMTRIGDRIGDDFEQLKLVQGYDHNFCVDGWKDDGQLRPVAIAKGPKSGRVMKVYSDLPGVQFYAGNCIGATTGKNGIHYDKRDGFCLETQYYPDTIHHENFPSYLFGGEGKDARDCDTVTVYHFE